MKNKYLLVHFIDFFFSANLEKIAQPSVCNGITHVFDNGVYEKTICYLDTNSNYFKAQAFCLNLGMKLYQLNTQASYSVLKESLTQFTGASEKNAFIEGYYDSKCVILNGQGMSDLVSCRDRHSFVCEYKDESKFLL
jgi:hypothetical protein